MRRLLILFFLLSLSLSYGQSKKAVKLFTHAQQDVTNNDFDEAMRKLNKALKDSPDYMQAILLAANIQTRLGNKEKSLDYYERAMQYKPPYYVNLFYGKALFENGKYAEAEGAFKAYQASPRANPKYTAEIDGLLRSCRFAIKATETPRPYEPVNLGPMVNSNQMEYFPSISADGNTLVFTHRNLEGNKRDEDFWVSVKNSEGEWGKGKPVQGRLNTVLNEGAQSITSDGGIIYFAGCERRDGYGSCDIYASFYEGNGNWSKPYNLGDSVNSRVWDSQPSISSDGKTLYFVRGRSGTSKNIDIYYSELKTNGSWSKARPIKGKVNSLGQDVSPFIHFDNQTLYFSSNGHPGMGDLDFFVSKREPDGSWGKPKNLGYPINNTGIEFSLIVAPDGKTGFFASDALGGEGLTDLYQFELPEETQAIEIAYIKGKVTNKSTGQPISAQLDFSDLKTGEDLINERSGKNGLYFSVLPSNSDYALNIQKKGFLFYSKNFSLETQAKERAFELNVELIPITIGEKVKLENVFFGFDSYELDRKSFIELDKVVQFMNENPKVKVGIEGHTDNEGSAAYNRNLSDNRAKSVYKYLQEKGIDPSRLSAKGYGASSPIADNSTEEGRQLNRRTELIITAY